VHGQRAVAHVDLLDEQLRDGSAILERAIREALGETFAPGTYGIHDLGLFKRPCVLSLQLIESRLQHAMLLFKSFAACTQFVEGNRSDLVSVYESSVGALATAHLLLRVPHIRCVSLHQRLNLFALRSQVRRQLLGFLQPVTHIRPDGDFYIVRSHVVAAFASMVTLAMASRAAVT
jgi:hypothetical protein